MALTYTSTSAPLDDVGVKFLIHGPAGYGKTVLAATMPGPSIIVSAESGLLSLQPANQERLFGKGNAVDIPVINVKTGQDFKDAYAILSGADGKGFKSIAVDSLSEIAEVILANELRLAKDPRQAYGRMQEVMTEYIRKFRDLHGKHVYFTAKQDKSADSDGVTRFGPMMPGKTLTQMVAHFFDEVFALCISQRDAQGNTYRYLRTRPDIQYNAKDRSGALDEIEEPNLSKIVSKIQTK